MARNQFPEDLELLGLDGTLRMACGDQAGAEACWKQVLWSRPVNPVSSLGLVPPTELETFPEPLQLLGNEMDADETVFPCAGHNLASLFRQQGRTDDAEAQWATVQEDYPGFGLGELYMDHSRWPELERMAEAMEREPRFVLEALVLRAQGFLARQEFDKARELLRLALSHDADFLKAKEILSLLMLQEDKEPTIAEMLLHEILQSDPRNTQTWLNLIAFVREQGRLAEAAALCQDARAHCPNDPDLLLISGAVLQEQGKCDLAEICLLPLSETSLATAEARQRCLTAKHFLARTYRDRGRLEDAINQWQNLLADTPDDLAAWVGLAEVHLARRDLNACTEIARRLSWRPDWSLEAKVLQARVALTGKDYFAAREFLEEVLADQPHDERALVLLSQALLQEGNDWMAAEKMLRRILHVNPQNVEAKHNLKILLEWQGGSTVIP